MELQKRILLVDDESSIRRTLSLGFAQNGYETESCMDGISALIKMNTLTKAGNSPSAIVIDIQLPDIMGTKLARIINFKYPNIPIFLITGYSNKLNPEDIKDLKITALLNKPVTSDELIQRFENIQIEQMAMPAVEPQVTESVSAYLLLKLDDSKNFFETYQKLYYMDNVLYCDATKGDYDIIMLIQGDSLNHTNHIIEQDIKSVEGIKEVEVLNLHAPILSETMEDIINTAEYALGEENEGKQSSREMSNQVCSYILLDVEKDKVEKVYPILRLNENTVYCDYTSGSFNMVLFHHGSFYSDIDKFIEEQLNNIDGVIRVKKYPVVNMFGM